MRLLPPRIDPAAIPRKKTPKKSKVIALCSLLAALGVVIMYLGAIIDVLDLTTAAFASMLCVVVMIEIGGVYPWLLYAVTGTLSFLLLPQKFGALIYVFLAGYYPMLKFVFERCKKRVTEWILKLAMFNAAMALLVIMSVFVLALPDMTKGYVIALFALGNFTFIVFDFALDLLIYLYIVKYRKQLRVERMLK